MSAKLSRTPTYVGEVSAQAKDNIRASQEEYSELRVVEGKGVSLTGYICTYIRTCIGSLALLVHTYMHRFSRPVGTYVYA